MRLFDWRQFGSAGNGSEFPSGGIEQVDIASVTKALRSDFDSVRCFHATRATEIASYYRHGIRPLTLDYWHEIVDECFTRAIVDPSVLSHLRVVRDRQFSTGQDGQVHFCCDDALLKHRDGYHLVYGSLSLLAVAIQIDKKFGTDFRSALRAKGVPVIFVCDVPMDRIDDASLEVLAGCRPSGNPAAPHIDSPGASSGPHFSISGALAPSAIAYHYRPVQVIDSVYGHHIE